MILYRESSEQYEMLDTARSENLKQNEKREGVAFVRGVYFF